MNFIFVSPNFPQTYWNFCDRLHADGVTVLGIGDEPYDSLHAELKRSLSDYYKVDSLSDYDQVFRAVAFFSFKYGKIDWIESNNEAWLENDACIRKDFNITTGVDTDAIAPFKSKAVQKIYYAKGKVPTARQHKVSGIEAAREFISVAGYPVFVKPEVGVGAAASYKISDEEGLVRFFDTKPPVPYVMEEFVTGDIYSYDAIVDSKGKPLFESATKFPPSMADIANNGWDCCYYVLKTIPAQLRKYGRATLKAFGVKSRFVHLEFFRLTVDKPGLGKKGDFVGLETNMRPAGGFTPDMMDYAHATDVYKIWADMVAFDARTLPEIPEDDHFCVHYGRRDGKAYVHGHDEVMAKYGPRMAMQCRIPDVLSNDLGNIMYMIHAYSLKEVEEFEAWMGES